MCEMRCQIKKGVRETNLDLFWAFLLMVLMQPLSSIPKASNAFLQLTIVIWLLVVQKKKEGKGKKKKGKRKRRSVSHSKNKKTQKENRKKEEKGRKRKKLRFVHDFLEERHSHTVRVFGAGHRRQVQGRWSSSWTCCRSWRAAPCTEDRHLPWQPWWQPTGAFVCGVVHGK